jgi:hypothetical protein
MIVAEYFQTEAVFRPVALCDWCGAPLGADGNVYWLARPDGETAPGVWFTCKEQPCPSYDKKLQADNPGYEALWAPFDEWIWQFVWASQPHQRKRLSAMARRGSIP